MDGANLPSTSSHSTSARVADTVVPAWLLRLVRIPSVPVDAGRSAPQGVTSHHHHTLHVHSSSEQHHHHHQHAPQQTPSSPHPWDEQAASFTAGPVASSSTWTGDRDSAGLGALSTALDVSLDLGREAGGASHSSSLHRHSGRRVLSAPQTGVNGDNSEPETAAAPDVAVVPPLPPPPPPLPAVLPTEAAPQTIGAAAEQHRLQTGGTIDVQTVTSWIEQTAPYTFLLVFIFNWHYSMGVLVVAWLMGALVQANQSLRKQVALKSNWQPLEMLHTTGYILANMVLAGWLTAEMRPWRCLLLLPPKTSLSVADSLFLVLTADALARFMGMLPKVGVLLACQLRAGGGTGRALRQQGRLLTALEHGALLYRTLVPISTWYVYFVGSVPQPWVASALAGVYLTLKGRSVVQRVQVVVLAARLVVRHGAVYGTYATRDDLEAGGCCPICQDTIDVGVRLDCGHVFCEDDISEWLERDRTCPMCRASVRPAGLVSYSDGASALMPQIF